MIFDTENLNSLTVQELAVLLLLYTKKGDKSRVLCEFKASDIKELFDSLSAKGFIFESVYATDFNHVPPLKKLAWSILEKGRQILADNCVSDKKATRKFANKALVSRCDNLAAKLMELYPAGTKPGTNQKWRGYPKGVSERLQKVILEGNDFTDEEAIEATKTYVTGFNGNYTRMRVLPYFIKKNEIIGGELDKKCDFMSYVTDVKNGTHSNSHSNDWDVELR